LERGHLISSLKDSRDNLLAEVWNRTLGAQFVLADLAGHNSSQCKLGANRPAWNDALVSLLLGMTWQP
jgi:hypothetical protein